MKWNLKLLNVHLNLKPLKPVLVLAHLKPKLIKSTLNFAILLLFQSCILCRLRNWKCWGLDPCSESSGCRSGRHWVQHEASVEFWCKTWRWCTSTFFFYMMHNAAFTGALFYRSHDHSWGESIAGVGMYFKARAQVLDLPGGRMSCVNKICNLTVI